MKYPKEIYESTVWFEDRDTVYRFYEAKIVKTRKTHACCKCNKEIAKNSDMLREKAILELGEEPSGFVYAYLCITCMNSWLDDEP